MKIRLLLVIPTMDRGGAEKQLCLLAEHLPSDLFDVQVALLTRGGPLEARLQDAEIPVTTIHKKWKIDPLAFRRLKRLIREFKPDIVHTWLFAANCYGRAAAHLAKVPVIIGGERCVDLWKRGYEFSIDRFLAKRSAAILTNSDGVRQFYLEHGLPADTFHVIPNGIDELQGDRQKARQELITRLGLPENARLIGAVGRLWPQKRLKDAIWAAELIRCVRDDTHLLIAGDGPQRWRLERFAEQVQVHEHIHFLGQVERPVDLIAALDQFWLASGYEGQSNALMEAMGLGVPVVVSDIPGNRDLVTHEETGLLFPKGDRGELAKQSQRLTENAELAERIAQKGRERIQQDFSIQSMIDRHASLYQQLVEEARG